MNLKLTSRLFIPHSDIFRACAVLCRNTYKLWYFLKMNSDYTTQNGLNQTIGFIGGGNMAKAICEGILTKGLLTAQQIYVAGPHLQNLTWWTKRGCHTFQENGVVVSKADIIFICVKPHILQIAIDDIYKTIPNKSKLIEPKLYVSILAGTTLDTLRRKLQNIQGRIIRVMPNTPMTVGEGCSLFTPNQTVTEDDIDLVNKILSVTGTCMQVPESLLDVAGALTACGPAFIYMALEALADGAVKMGVPRDLATKLASQMTLGAAKMARDSGKHTAQLKDEVCSAGGSTIQGVYALEKGGMRSAFIEAIEVSARRAAELGQK